MKSKFFILIFIVCSVWTLVAQEPVRFTASAPSTVILDKPFQLVYSVNATCKDLRAPEILNFDILAGPFQSSSSSIQIVNGKSTSSTAVSFTYTLQAQKTGTFTIPSASVVVQNQKYSSNGLSIKVLPADTPTPRSKNGQSNSASNAQETAADNIFIKTNVSKTNVYEQEVILLTYKLYTLPDVIQCGYKKLPDFNGFMKQEVEQTQNKQFAYEHLNGKNYSTVVLYQVLLYPQHPGIIEIPKTTFEAAIRIQNRRAARSIFDDFFESYTNVSKNLVAPSVKISVNALPANKPASFTGTVGHFSLSSSISANSVKANDAVTLKLNISGVGNMKLIKTPVIKFPDGFETYDPKVNNNFKTTSAGVSGSKSIEYLIIPRHSGNYEIPTAEFSYFDTQEKVYKTLKTPAYKLEVLKGEGGSEGPTVVGTYVDKEDVKQLGKDIRYIQTDNISLIKEEEPLFGTLICWLLYLLPLSISILLFVFFRKQAKENSDLSFVKNKKANKVAQKRLKLAQRLLSDGKKDLFYEEVLKAVWTYLSDKLSLPVSELTKDSVELELSKRSVNSEQIKELLTILNTCEFARYAPNTGQEEMGNLYTETISAISNLEDSIKK